LANYLFVDAKKYELRDIKFKKKSVPGLVMLTFMHTIAKCSNIKLPKCYDENNKKIPQPS